MDNVNKGFDIHKYIINKAETYQQRYIEAEQFIFKLQSLPWYKRLFKMDEEIIEFIRSRKKFEK
jgi:hypothetical protein